MASPIPRHELPTPLRLHIGGEEVRQGWKILNIQPKPGVDYIGDCTDLSQFPDDCCKQIYASHVYEHLSYQVQLIPALREALRVLEPGGLIQIGVPDLDVLCRMYLDPRLTLEERFFVQRMIFGGQRDEHDYHRVGLNYQLLEKYLTGVGFTSVHRVKEFNLFKDITSERHMGMLISLNVSAMKPPRR